MYGCYFCRLDAKKKSEVESQDECVLLQLAPTPGTIILSLRTSHPFIHFYSVLYRTRNRFFSSIWDPDLFFFKLVIVITKAAPTFFYSC